MECKSLLINDNYRFLSEFDAYKSLIENVPMSSTENEVGKTCDSLSSDSILNKVSSSNNICKQFIHLYSKLSTTLKRKKKTNSLDDNDYSFMNYWINDTLSSSNVNASDYIKELYTKLKEADKNTFFNVDFSVEKFSSMKLHDLKNIKILIDLYNRMHEVNGTYSECQAKEEYTSFLRKTREFNEIYKGVIINCIDGCPDFYNALELLKCKYNEDIIGYANMLSRLEFNKFDELQDYNFVLKEHNTKQFKKILTIPILFPIFGLLFMLFFSNKVKGTTYIMLSPFRQFLLEEINMIRNRGIFEYGSNKLLLRSSDHENINYGYGDYNMGYYSLRDA
ncbi:PIR Superfamily Protein [Plasmodium ovale wallikeri]|uniref:PIR Superfamily Protein n=1 Tax=Plasmodium ovale wallikeri TaxID=864142 RepID=A0A1A9AHH2_PLAOA|nr:PIR Superfamily Protein [Plasmodium ovale wallikeri]SBT55547.1 PIR Superfamily Protein [Plasmodium ovale wallikeri]